MYGLKSLSENLMDKRMGAPGSNGRKMSRA
jgi:hypothetical protein